MIRPALLCLLILLPGCTAMSAAKLLTGGGPNVAANVQAGKTNSQTIGQTQVTEQKLVRPQARSIEQSTGSTKVRSERVEAVTVNEKDSLWLVLLLALFAATTAAALVWGWLSPSPRERKLDRENAELQIELERSLNLLVSKPSEF